MKRLVVPQAHVKRRCLGCLMKRVITHTHTHLLARLQKDVELMMFLIEEPLCNSLNAYLTPPIRVRTVMVNLEKSLNFKMVISRPGKVLEKT